MIEFKKVKARNFFSVGNKPIELEIKEENIFVVHGTNGSGKSSILLDTVFFALYGKSFRKVNVANMINSTNKKNLYVELEFKIGENEYRIERGLKPDVFAIYINGTLKPQEAKTKDYQNFLSTQILKMDETTFRQLVVVGSTSYTPFMQLKVADRRTVIEDLLRIDVFSQMLSFVKIDASETKNNITDKKSQRDVTQAKIETTKKSSDSFKDNMEKTIKDTKESITERQTTKESLQKEKELIMEDFSVSVMKDLAKKVNEIKKVIPTLLSQKSAEMAVVSEYTKNKTFFEDNLLCPVCTQSITNEKKKEKIEEYSSMISEKDISISTISDKLEKLSELQKDSTTKLKELKEKYDKIEKLKREIQEIDNQLVFYNKQIESCNMSLDNINNSVSEDVSVLEKTLVNIEQEIEQLRLEDHAIKYILMLLKDDGVKKLIIKNYLPVINNLIQKYIEITGLNVVFSFDESFSESIVVRNRYMYEYNNLSEGERLRIDYAILFAFRELAKMRSSICTNLLIFDEADKGTLDDDGFNAIREIMESCSQESIWIITHNLEQFSSLASEIIEVSKPNGFTSIRKH